MSDKNWQLIEGDQLAAPDIKAQLRTWADAVDGLGQSGLRSSQLRKAADYIAMLESEAEQLRMSWKNSEQYANRYHWALPILTGGTDAIADARAMCLAAALMGGLDGDAAIDSAIAASAQ